MVLCLYSDLSMSQNRLPLDFGLEQISKSELTDHQILPVGEMGGGAGIKTGNMGVFLLTWAGKGLPCLLLSLLCPHSSSSLFLFLLSLLLALLPTRSIPLFMGSESLMAKCSTAALETHALEDKELAQENPWASLIKCTRNQKKGRNEHFDCGHPS